MKPQIFVFKNADSEKAYDFILNFACEKLKLSYTPQIMKDKNGKPYLKDFPHFYFNISHSGLFLAIAFAHSPIGVDIEKKREVNLKIKERYFAEDERRFVKDTDSFFCVWTRKEALLKQTGEGIRKRLSSFSVLNNNSIKTFKEKDFILSVCCDTSEDYELIYKENFCGDLKTRN